MEIAGIPLREIIGIAACLIGSAFFSGSETALTRITGARAAVLIEQSPGRYGILKLWMTSKKRLLATLLVGNNLVNILCSILAYRVAMRLLPGYAEAVSVFGLTLVILVFAEITPKSLALNNAEKIVVPILRVVWLIDKLLLPLAWPLSRIPGLIMRGDDATDEPVATEDEIEFHIRRGVDRSVFEEKEQGELLKSAVEFSDIMVKEIMVPRTDIFGLEKGTSISDALGEVIESGHSRVPVYGTNLDNILGVLYAKDLLGVKIGGHGEKPIETVMRIETMIAPETQAINLLLTDMRHRGMHMAMVVDEFGGTSGLVTLEDIIEELVGEIRDEFDPENAMIRSLGENRWLVDARLSLNDLEHVTGISLPDTGDYESVGGFVVARYSRIPRRGRVITIDGLEFIVVDSDSRHVKKLELRKVKTDPPGKDVLE
jgi:putative hemolysin